MFAVQFSEICSPTFLLLQIIAYIMFVSKHGFGIIIFESMTEYYYQVLRCLRGKVRRKIPLLQKSESPK